MGRPKRAADGGLVYHVLNRSNAKMPIFAKEADYEAFERVLEEAVQRSETRLLAYCVLRTHWHLVVWPREDGELSRFTGWLTLTHTQRWHAHRRSTGTGHVYQGRFKSFPVQEDGHFYTVPVRGEVVKKSWDRLPACHFTRISDRLEAYPTQ
jgi:putative transposase